MKNVLLTLFVILLGLAATAAMAQDDGEVTEPGFHNGPGECQFVDEDGDGFNDLAPDADGDGIPNGLDPDYVPAGDGTAEQAQWGRLEEFLAHFGMQTMTREGIQTQAEYGPGDGSGPAGPNDEMDGFGPGSATGDGPNGSDSSDNGNAGEETGGGRDDRGSGR